MAKISLKASAFTFCGVIYKWIYLIQHFSNFFLKWSNSQFINFIEVFYILKFA